MRKIIMTALGLVLMSGISNAFASDIPVYFYTEADRDANCPAIDSLTFTPSNPTIPISGGIISGTKNNLSFATGFGHRYVYRPSEMINQVVQGVEWNTVEYPNMAPVYGMILANCVHCYYTYPSGSSHTTTMLVLDARQL